ncbi:MAG: hypothetical protein SPI94_06755 [Candidatus Onthovivens sp.]|nr:hypothetical protein [Candidatus Onthovivens sp.]
MIDRPALVFSVFCSEYSLECLYCLPCPKSPERNSSLFASISALFLAISAALVFIMA